MFLICLIYSPFNRNTIILKNLIEVFCYYIICIYIISQYNYFENKSPECESTYKSVLYISRPTINK